MSIEQLVADFPPGKDFVTDISFEKEFQQPRARVVALAALFYRKGHEGLIELDKTLTDRGVSINRDNVPSSDLTRAEKDMLSNNKAAVMWGSLVDLFEEMLVEGEYHPLTLKYRYDAGFQGSTWNGKLKFLSVNPLKLAPHEKARLSAMIKQDMSFAGFLSEDGLRSLPSELTKTILGSGDLYTINTFIMPQYKARADLLLAAKG